MLNQKLIALLVACALTLGAVGAGAFATEQSAPAKEEEPTVGAAQNANSPLEQGEQAAPAAEVKVDTAPVGRKGATGGNTLAFDQINSRMKANNLNLLALSETIATLEAMDYDALTETLQEQVKTVAKTQLQLLSMGALVTAGLELLDQTIPNFEVTAADKFVLFTSVTISAAATAASMEQATSALKSTLNDLESGKMQADNEAIIRQLRNAQNQIVMAAQTMYVALVNLEMRQAALVRSEAALNRTAKEMELRYQLGQISALNLQQVKSGQTQLTSGKQTLGMNVDNLKRQLALMVGGDPEQVLSLQPIKGVSAQQLGSMDLKKDTEKAKAASYNLFAAKRTYDEAKAQFALSEGQSGYQLEMAQHTWQAAQYTYEATLQNFEVGMQSLYAQVKDCAQILTAAQTALGVEKATFASMQLRYSQGSISQNALLKAQDDLSAAQDTVDGAALELFSAYNNYCWAVNYGILN